MYNWASGNDSFKLSNLIFLPTFTIEGYKQIRTEETLTTGKKRKQKDWLEKLFFPGTFTRLICDIYFVRSLGYYLYQVYMPAFLIVLISWVPFWLDHEDNHARVGLGVTTVLTITTLTTSTIENLPKISYIKAIDIYLFTCFFMVFLSLIEYATVGFYETKRRSRMVKRRDSEEDEEDEVTRHHQQQSLLHDTSKIDQYSRVAFPAVFLLFNFCYAISISLFIWKANTSIDQDNWSSKLVRN